MAVQRPSRRLHSIRLFYPLNGTEHGSQPFLTTHDRELVCVLEVRIEPGDLNPRPHSADRHSTNSTTGWGDIISKLKITGALPNSMPTKIVLFNHFFAQHISCLSNESPECEIFPKVLKSALVTPIFQNGDPISLLIILDQFQFSTG